MSRVFDVSKRTLSAQGIRSNVFPSRRAMQPEEIDEESALQGGSTAVPFEPEGDGSDFDSEAEEQEAPVQDIETSDDEVVLYRRPIPAPTPPRVPPLAVRTGLAAPKALPGAAAAKALPAAAAAKALPAAGAAKALPAAKAGQRRRREPSPAPQPLEVEPPFGLIPIQDLPKGTPWRHYALTPDQRNAETGYFLELGALAARGLEAGRQQHH